MTYQNTTERALAYYQCDSGFTWKETSQQYVEQMGTGALHLSAVNSNQVQDVLYPHTVGEINDKKANNSIFYSFLVDDVVLQSQPAWIIAVMVVFIIVASVCVTFMVALFTLMFRRKHKCKFLKIY